MPDVRELYQINQEQCKMRWGIATAAIAAVRWLMLAAPAPAAESVAGTGPNAGVWLVWQPHVIRSGETAGSSLSQQQTHWHAS